MMIPTPIAISSDDRLFSDALTDILCSDATIAVVDRDGAVDAARAQIAIVDARSGRSSHHLWPAGDGDPPLVIFVGAPDDDAWALDALDLGARGILTRTASRDDLFKAIAIVRQGGIWACRRWLNACVLRDIQRAAARTGAPSLRLPAGARLSRREEEVLQHAVAGAGNKQLALQLAISEATVKVHLTRIYQKLGVTGRAELAAVYYGLRKPLPAGASLAQPAGR